MLEFSQLAILVAVVMHSVEVEGVLLVVSLCKLYKTYFFSVMEFSKVDIDSFLQLAVESSRGKRQLAV